MENANRVLEYCAVDFLCCTLFEKECSHSGCRIDSQEKGKIGRHVICVFGGHLHKSQNLQRIMMIEKWGWWRHRGSDMCSLFSEFGTEREDEGCFI